MVVFSDEKDFHMDKYVNRRSLRYISTAVKATAPDVGYSDKFKSMIMGVVCVNRKAPPPIRIKREIWMAR